MLALVLALSVLTVAPGRMVRVTGGRVRKKHSAKAAATAQIANCTTPNLPSWCRSSPTSEVSAPPAVESEPEPAVPEQVEGMVTSIGGRMKLRVMPAWDMSTPIEVARARSSCGNQFAATCVMQPSSSGVETEITAVPPSIQPKELGWGWLAKQRMPAPVASARAPPTTAQRRPFGRVRSQTAGMMNGMYPR